jgi:nicotinic acid mononucleotide adenylyltransferase
MTSLAELIAGKDECFRQGSGPSPGRQEIAILPGAFDPLHVGHLGMAQLAEEKLGKQVHFELSMVNVDKPPLDQETCQRRLAQFGPRQSIWLTRAAHFSEKAKLFPQATFVVGVDTIRRVGDPKYYADINTMLRTIDWIASTGCRFLVFGRIIGQRKFRTLDDLDLPAELNAICQQVDEDAFRVDISSTELKKHFDTATSPKSTLSRNIGNRSKSDGA